MSQLFDKIWPWRYNGKFDGICWCFNALLRENLYTLPQYTSHFVGAGLFTCRASLRWTNLAEISGCAANETCWCLVSPCEGLIFCNCSCSANYQPLPACLTLRHALDPNSQSPLRSVLGVETNVLRPPSDPPLKQVRMPLKVAGVLDLPVQTVGSSNSSEFFFDLGHTYSIYY